MSKKAVSVTLEDDNLLWLRGQATAQRLRSLSEALDRLITDARASGRFAATTIRSVVGTVDIAGDDPDLQHADATMRGLFESSLERPVLVRDTPPAYSAGSRRKGRRG